jgi:hypothetical protein
MRLGQIYAGRLIEGTPAVIRIQNLTPELAHVVILSSDMLGHEFTARTASLADRFRLVSDGPDFTSEQVAAWLAEIT